jgi:hypothetical protein
MFPVRQGTLHITEIICPPAGDTALQQRHRRITNATADHKTASPKGRKKITWKTRLSALNSCALERN